MESYFFSLKNNTFKMEDIITVAYVDKDEGAVGGEGEGHREQTVCLPLWRRSVWW
jgi:hypothetical protein